jgi:hypothetical protein
VKLQNPECKGIAIYPQKITVWKTGRTTQYYTMKIQHLETLACLLVFGGNFTSYILNRISYQETQELKFFQD